MDFLNKLGKKTSETYQVTKEKVTNLSEELKIRGKISNIKDSIEKIYTEIGEIAYLEIRDGKDVSRDAVVAKCEEISRKLDEISKLESELLAIKKVKKCTDCNAEINLEDEFCSKCGKEQPKIEKVEVAEESEPEVKEAEVVNSDSTNNNDNQ